MHLQRVISFFGPIRIWKILLFVLYIPALLVKLAHADSHGCCPQKSMPIEKKTLTRTADPVMIQGQNLKALLGKPIEYLRVYAAQRGVLAPIPYQIDERDLANRLALPEGPRPNLDGDQGRLDGNDELVLMAKDLGDRVAKEDWIPGYEVGLEIEVQDPLTDSRGWAYIFYFLNPPARSPVDYVRYILTSTENTVSTENYLVSSSPESAYYRKLLVTEVGGGNGQNLIRKTRIEGRVRLEWFFLLGAIKTFKRDEDDIEFHITAYKDGPIRIILRGKPELELIMGKKLPSEEVDSIYYVNQLYTTHIIHSPVKISRYCSQATVLGTLDFNENAFGMKFYNSNNPQGVVLDGVMSEAEKNLDRSRNSWSILTGQQGTLLTRLTWGPTLDQLKDTLYYLDTTLLLPDQKTRLLSARIGYLFDLLSVDKGRHLYQIHFYFPSSYRPGDEVNYLNILDNPLEVVVQDEVNLGMRLPREKK